MKFNRPKDRKEWVSMALLGGSAIMLVLILVKVGAYAVGTVPDPNTTAALAAGSMDDKQLEELLGDGKKAADALKKGLFVPPPPEPQPPRNISGILGDQVLMGGKWYKVGDMMGGAKVLAIEATCVRIEWQGKEMTVAPIAAAVPSSGPSGPQPKRKAKKGKQHKNDAPAPQAPQQADPVEIDDLAWLDIPDHLKEKFRQYWDQMSDEQKGKMKEQWNSMSEEEKEQAREAWSSM